MTTNGRRGRDLGERMPKQEGDRIANEVLALVRHIAETAPTEEPGAPGPPPCPRCGFAGGPVSAESGDRAWNSATGR